jgi:hypothetical protein
MACGGGQSFAGLDAPPAAGGPLRRGLEGQRGHRSATKLAVAQRASGTVVVAGRDVPFASCEPIGCGAVPGATCMIG